MGPLSYPLLASEAYPVTDLDFARSLYRLGGRSRGALTDVPGWSFTRASEGYALNSAGVLVPFASGVPRITDLGILVEEARTNIALYSQEFDNAGWTKGGATVTSNATTAPDLTVTADKLVEDTSTGLHRASQIITKAASAITYTYTVYAKASERTQLRLTLDDVGVNSGGATFDLSSGTISTAAAVTGDFTNVSASIVAVGTWHRLSLTVTSNTATSIRPQVQMAVAGSVSYTGSSGSGLFVWQADLQAGSFATSPIATAGSAVTREASGIPFTLPAGLSSDTIRIEYTGGVVTSTRGVLAPADVLELGATSGGAWVNKYIQRVTVRRAA